MFSKKGITADKIKMNPLGDFLLIQLWLVPGIILTCNEEYTQQICYYSWTEKVAMSQPFHVALGCLQPTVKLVNILFLFCIWSNCSWVQKTLHSKCIVIWDDLHSLLTYLKCGFFGTSCPSVKDEVPKIVG